MSDTVQSHVGTALLSSSSWLQLTPKDAAHGPTCLVNMSQATSVWEEKDGSEVWFGGQHDNEKFEVRETVAEIGALLSVQGAPPSAPAPGPMATTSAVSAQHHAV